MIFRMRNVVWNFNFYIENVSILKIRVLVIKKSLNKKLFPDLQQGYNDCQTDLCSQESGVHANNQVFEVSSAAIFSNCYGSEKMSTLAINHEDQMSLGHI